MLRKIARNRFIFRREHRVPFPQTFQPLFVHSITPVRRAATPGVLRAYTGFHLTGYNAKRIVTYDSEDYYR